MEARDRSGPGDTLAATAADLGHHRGMAVVNDMLYQLAGSAVDETEIAEELRVDAATARRCLERLRALGVVEGPERIEGSNMWSPIDAEEFPDLVARAKAAGVDVRETITDFAAAAAG